MRPVSPDPNIQTLRNQLEAGLVVGQGDCLHDAARSVLIENQVQLKLVGLDVLIARVTARQLAPSAQIAVRRGPDTPGRPDHPVLVPPRELRQRKLGTVEGRAALLHAVAHIEFNAINLVLDAVQRFSGLPIPYYADWLSVAHDEARHFRLLTQRLEQLGHQYGDFPAHDGLWQMALLSADDPLPRMALVPRLLEARGLDVTPAMMERLRSVGDHASADILAVILSEEVRHVAIGDHWYKCFCAELGVSPEQHFRTLLQACAPGALRPPFNEAARRAAGFSAEELALLARS